MTTSAHSGRRRQPERQPDIAVQRRNPLEERRPPAVAIDRRTRARMNDDHRRPTDFVRALDHTQYVRVGRASVHADDERVPHPSFRRNAE